MQKEQYAEIKERFGSKQIVGFSDAEQARLGDVLALLERKGYIHNMDVNNTNAYRRIGNFEDFEEWYRAMEQEKTRAENVLKTSVSIGTLVTNNSNIVFGDAINSSFSIDNSISNIEREIAEKGGDDAEELKAILDEVKELVEIINGSRHIPKSRGIFQKITEHLDKHGWFYAEIVGLLGAVAMQLLGG